MSIIFTRGILTRREKSYAETEHLQTPIFYAEAFDQNEVMNFAFSFNSFAIGSEIMIERWS